MRICMLEVVRELGQVHAHRQPRAVLLQGRQDTEHAPAHMRRRGCEAVVAHEALKYCVWRIALAHRQGLGALAVHDLRHVPQERLGARRVVQARQHGRHACANER